MRCGICGETYEKRGMQPLWNRPHFKDTHPEYCSWYKKWGRNFMLSTILGIPVLILADIFSFRIGNSYLPIAAAVLYIIAAELWILQWSRKIREVKRTWQKEHGNH